MTINEIESATEILDTESVESQDIELGEITDNAEAEKADDSSTAETENTPNEPEEAEEVEEIEPEVEEPKSKIEEPLSPSELDTIKAMRAELEALKKELSESRALYERLESECAEFSALFPDVAVSALPDSIWQSVKNGIPLPAAYALELKRAEHEATLAKQVNADNKKMSSGALTSDNKNHIFSPTEVKSMTKAEIRANYSQIIHSMAKWN